MAALLLLALAAPPSAAEASNAFAVDLYQIVRPHKGNLFLSPLSLASPFALAASGARGDTRSQMLRALHLPSGDPAPAFGKLLDGLRLRTAKGTTIRLASGIWAAKDLALAPGFRKTARLFGNAHVEQLDFHAAEGSRQAINRWVEKRTRGRVKDLLPPGSVSRDARMILASAIHLKGDWASPFRKEDTRDGDFAALGGKTRVAFMSQRGEFAHRAGPAVAVLEMPFAGKEISMAFLLPNPGIDLDSLEKSLTVERLAGWLRDLKTRQVDVQVPRFKLAIQYALRDTLRGRMSLAFSPRADFGGMADKKIQLTDAFHRAYIDVNEKGSEAGAATALAVTPLSIEPRVPLFRADRPFLFLVRDRKTGCILFLGRLAQPRSEK